MPDNQILLTQFDQDQRIAIEIHGMRKEILPYVVRFTRDEPGMNFILYSDLDENNAAAVIKEQIAYFNQLGQPFEWKVYDHDRPADLKVRLMRHGFKPEDPDAVMVLALGQAPATLLAPIGADVRRISHPDQLQDVITVLEQVWERKFDWIWQRMGGELKVPNLLSVYVAYVDEQPACAGWVYFRPPGQFASLWGGSTVADYRGRGLYTAVLAVRVQEAIQRGAQYLTIDASPMSRPIVARHGFRVLTYAHACEWKGE